MLDIGVLSVDVRLLKTMVYEHKAQIDALCDLSTFLVQAHFAMRESHGHLVDRHLALTSCICKTGLISSEDLFQAQKARSQYHFQHLLGEPELAHLLLRHLGLAATQMLLRTSRDGAKLLASAAAAQGACLGVAESRRQAAPAASSSQRAFPWEASLQGLWGVRALADRLAALAGASAVRRLQAASSSGRACLQPVQAKVARRPFKVRGEESAVELRARGRLAEGPESLRKGPRRKDLAARSGSLQFCNFLQDIWQYSTLADALMYSMDSAGRRQFRVLSRACCECIRSHVSSEQVLDTRRVRVQSTSSEMFVLHSAPVQAESQAGAPSPEGQTRDPRRPRGRRADGSAPPKAARAKASSSTEPRVGSGVAASAAAGAAEGQLPASAARSGAQEEPGADHPSPDAAQPADGSLAVRPASRPADGALTARAPQPGATQPEDGAVTARAAQPTSQSVAARGRTVRLCGLRRSMHLNGQLGRLLHGAELSRHWHVQLFSGECIRVKPANIEFMKEREREKEREKEPPHGERDQRNAALGPEAPSSVQLSATVAPWPRSDVAERRLVLLRLVCASPRILPKVSRCAGPSAICALAASSEALFRRISGHGRLFVCGGCGPDGVLSSVECLDLATGTWQRATEMTGAREGAVTAALAGQLYICGGNSVRGGADGSSWLSSVERFDPLAGAWEPMPPLSTPRVSPGVGVVGSRIYLVGGQFHVPLRSAECFDPKQQAWQGVAPMQRARAQPTVAVADGRLCVCGGADLGYLSSAERYDPRSETWESLPSMTEQRLLGASAVQGNRIFVCGGHGGEDLRSCERLDPGASAWQPLPPMLQARSGATALSVRQRHSIVVCGGSSEQSAPVEALDLRAEAWTALQPPLSHHPSASAIVLVAGHLYICGGEGSEGPTGATERLDLATGKWEAVAPMGQPRAKAIGFHTLF